jgi:hypothetical protein
MAVNVPAAPASTPVSAAPIKNLAAFDAAVRAVCPAIDGVSGDGSIQFQAAATPAQITAAQTLATAYVDPPPAPVPDLALLVQELQTLGVLPPASVAKVLKAATAAAPQPPLASLPLGKPITQA